jgi:hypothetical protein
MALTNKNGLTPGQVTLQKEILDRFDSLEAQNAELKAQNDALINHIAELKKALEKFQKGSAASQSHNFAELKAGISRIDDVSFSFDRNIREKLEKHQDFMKPLLIFFLAFLALNLYLTYTAVQSSRQARNGVYMINELLRGDTSFWYDADNHQLYIRDRNDTGQ